MSFPQKDFWNKKNHFLLYIFIIIIFISLPKSSLNFNISNDYTMWNFTASKNKIIDGHSFSSDTIISATNKNISGYVHINYKKDTIDNIFYIIEKNPIGIKTNFSSIIFIIKTKPENNYYYVCPGGIGNFHLQKCYTHGLCDPSNPENSFKVVKEILKEHKRWNLECYYDGNFINILYQGTGILLKFNPVNANYKLINNNYAFYYSNIDYSTKYGDEIQGYYNGQNVIFNYTNTNSKKNKNFIYTFKYADYISNITQSIGSISMDDSYIYINAIFYSKSSGEFPIYVKYKTFKNFTNIIDSASISNTEQYYHKILLPCDENFIINEIFFLKDPSYFYFSMKCKGQEQWGIGSIKPVEIFFLTNQTINNIDILTTNGKGLLVEDSTENWYIICQHKYKDTECIYCSNKVLLNFNGKNECIDKCPNYYFSISDKIITDPEMKGCYKCYEDCDTCSDHGTSAKMNCKTCKDAKNTTLPYFYKSNCYNKCPDKTISEKNDNYICYSCEDKGLYTESGKTCVAKCSDYFVNDTIAKTCTECTSDKPYYYDNKCISECPYGTILSNNKKECISCLKNDNETYYYNYKCYKNCPESTYIFSEEKKICLKNLNDFNNSRSMIDKIKTRLTNDIQMVDNYIKSFKDFNDSDKINYLRKEKIKLDSNISIYNNKQGTNENLKNIINQVLLVSGYLANINSSSNYTADFQNFRNDFKESQSKVLNILSNNFNCDKLNKLIKGISKNLEKGMKMLILFFSQITYNSDTIKKENFDKLVNMTVCLNEKFEDYWKEVEDFMVSNQNDINGIVREVKKDAINLIIIGINNLVNIININEEGFFEEKDVNYTGLLNATSTRIIYQHILSSAKLLNEYGDGIYNFSNNLTINITKNKYYDDNLKDNSKVNINEDEVFNLAEFNYSDKNIILQYYPDYFLKAYNAYLGQLLVFDSPLAPLFYYNRKNQINKLVKTFISIRIFDKELNEIKVNDIPEKYRPMIYYKQIVNETNENCFYINTKYFDLEIEGFTMDKKFNLNEENYLKCVPSHLSEFTAGRYDNFHSDLKLIFFFIGVVIFVAMFSFCFICCAMHHKVDAYTEKQAKMEMQFLN